MEIVYKENKIKLAFRDIKTEELQLASDLVWEVFSEFEAPEYSAEGVQTFREFIHPERLKKEIEENGFKLYGCLEDGAFVGVIAFRQTTHISLLFTKKSHHQRGIAKELFRIGREKALEEKPEATEFTVNSSPFAIKIYEKLGFESIDKLQEKDGLKYMPMRYRVTKE